MAAFGFLTTGTPTLPYPNTLIFVDLSSDDPAACAEFYADIFGWENDPRPYGGAEILWRDHYWKEFNGLNHSFRDPWGNEIVLWRKGGENPEIPAHYTRE